VADHGLGLLPAQVLEHQYAAEAHRAGIDAVEIEVNAIHLGSEAVQRERSGSSRRCQVVEPAE